MASESMMSRAGPSTDQIVGFVRISVIEAKDIAILDSYTKSSDPYAKRSIVGMIRLKLKNLNPVWNRQFHAWILQSQTPELIVEVYDEDLIKDDFAGLVKITLPLEDKVIDQWYDLQGREGKKDKHVKGSIHLKFEIGVTKRNVATSLWTKPTYIMVDPDLQVQQRTFMIEIQGNVDDELMNIFVAGIHIPAPQRFYDTDGAPSSWKIKVPYKALTPDVDETKRVIDRTQNYMLQIWNRFRELGWFYVTKNGDNLLFLNFPSTAPWYAPPPSNTKPLDYPGFIAVDQRPLIGKLELQGDIHPSVVEEAAAGYEHEKILDKDGTFLRWVIKVGNQISWTQKGARKEAQRFQRALLNVLHVLGRHGYIYISDYNLPSPYAPPHAQHAQEQQYHSFYSSPHDLREKTHIMYRDTSTWYYATAVCPPTYLLVDPRPFDWKIAIQGPIDMKMFREFNPSFPEPTDFTDKDGSHLSWLWKVRNVDRIAWTAKEWKRIENRFQNYMLQVFDGIARMGFRYLNDVGKTALFVIQGPPQPSTQHITVDFSWFNYKPIMEFQGTIDGNLLNEIGQATGLNTAQEILDADGTHLCYSSVIPYDRDFLPSVTELRRLENQFQCYLLKAFDVLNLVGYEYVTAQKNTHIFMKREVPTPIPPVTWLLVDPSWNAKQGFVVEIQGRIDQSVLTNIGQSLNNPGDALVNDKSGERFGWYYVVPGTDSGAWTTTGVKRKENRLQNYALRILEVLYSYGWFPVEKADTARGVFLTRRV